MGGGIVGAIGLRKFSPAGIFFYASLLGVVYLVDLRYLPLHSLVVRMERQSMNRATSRLAEVDRTIHDSDIFPRGWHQRKRIDTLPKN